MVVASAFNSSGPQRPSPVKVNVTLLAE